MAPLARTLRMRLQPRDGARPEPGDVIAVRALIRAPSPPAYPGAFFLWGDGFVWIFGGSVGLGVGSCGFFLWVGIVVLVRGSPVWVFFGIVCVGFEDCLWGGVCVCDCECVGVWELFFLRMFLVVVRSGVGLNGWVWDCG
jgi:hypothetical protein